MLSYSKPTVAIEVRIKSRTITQLYKVVRPDYTDKHSGSVDNHPGQIPEMLRNKVDDRRENTCSHGYHIGNLEYIKCFGCEGDKVLLVKVNPKDAVSVPADHNATKLRVCRYEVLSDYQGDIELQKKTELSESCYNDEGEEWEDGEYDENDSYDPCENCQRVDNVGCSGCVLYED
jgi:hypothetical protein